MLLNDVKHFVLVIACVYSVRVTALLCTTCLYDEGVSYTANRTCLTNPSIHPTDPSNCSYCMTAAGIYGVDHTLRVYRGCNSTEEFDWVNECRFEKFNFAYDGYVCLCDNEDLCNSDDDAYPLCYQCNSIDDDDCYADLNDNVPQPCLTGYSNCVMDTKEPYPHHNGVYDGQALYDYVRRYCSDNNYGFPGTYVDYYLKSLHCLHSCSIDGCNDMADVCIIDKTIQCKECAYEEDNPHASMYECLTSPQTVPTTECYSKCYTKSWYTEEGGLNIVRGCDRDLSYDWIDSCRLIDGRDYICTCRSSDSQCNGDNLGFTQCYQCDSRQDNDCLDGNVDGLDVLPCLTGQTGCVTEITEPYPESKHDITAGNENMDYVRRYCDHVDTPYFYCVDYLTVAQKCVHACTEDGCTFKQNECPSRENITDPITCVSCEYNSASSYTDKACLTNPVSTDTIVCNSSCITRAYSHEGTFWVYRGCDCENEFTWENSCNDVSLSEGGVANVCTCSNEDLCNADDSDKHLCYQCDSRRDGDCYASLWSNTPTPCFSGSTACVTEMMEPYEKFTIIPGSSNYDYITRYCGNDEYGTEGLCKMYRGTSLQCFYSCTGDGCNNIIFDTASIQCSNLGLAIISTAIVRLFTSFISI